MGPRGKRISVSIVESRTNSHLAPQAIPKNPIKVVQIFINTSFAIKMAHTDSPTAIKEAITAMMQLGISSADELKTSNPGNQSSTAADPERFSFSALVSVETKPLPPAAASDLPQLSHEEFEGVWARWRDLAFGDDHDAPDPMVQAQVIGPNREVDRDWVNIFGSE